MEQKEVTLNSPRAWMLAARPKTLSGAAVPVMIGTALALSDHISTGGQVSFKVIPAVLCFLFAFIMQIDANFVNDLFDYLKGSDDRATRLGPKRACTEGWVTVRAMKFAVALTTTLACVVGLPLIVYGGLEMILVGMVCVVFCFLYTTSLAGRGLGDVLVLVFFGILPVCVTYYIQAATVTVSVFVASVACGLVIDCLLVVNNFRDRDADRDVNKLTLVVRIGERASLALYLALGCVACLLGVVFMPAHPLATVLPVAYLVLHVKAYFDMKRIYRGRELNKCLGATARNMFIYGLTVSAGLLI